MHATVTSECPIDERAVSSRLDDLSLDGSDMLATLELLPSADDARGDEPERHDLDLPIGADGLSIEV